MYTKRDVEKLFKIINPSFKEWDKFKQRTIWNEWTDSLCKDGIISQKQYNDWLYPRYFKK